MCCNINESLLYFNGFESSIEIKSSSFSSSSSSSLDFFFYLVLVFFFLIFFFCLVVCCYLFTLWQSIKWDKCLFFNSFELLLGFDLCIDAKDDLFNFRLLFFFFCSFLILFFFSIFIQRRTNYNWKYFGVHVTTIEIWLKIKTSHTKLKTTIFLVSLRHTVTTKGNKIIHKIPLNCILFYWQRILNRKKNDFLLSFFRSFFFLNLI